jgi:replicative DNA helicase
MTKDTLLDRSKYIEHDLISSILFDPKKSVRASTAVTIDDFYHYGKQFSIITKAHMDGKSVSLELKHEGLHVYEFTEGGSFRPIDLICKDLKSVSNALRIYTTLAKASESVPYEDIDVFVSEVQRDIMNSVQSAEKESTSMSVIAEEWRQLRDSYVQKIKDGKTLIGISCGYPKIDKIIDGLRPGHLWIMGGYTSMGKTFASLNIVADLIKQGKRVVYYSIEMTSADIVSRIIGIMTGQNGKSIIKGYGNQSLAEQAMQELIKSNLSIHTTKSSLSEIQFSMYEENITLPVDLFVVDYMQLVQVKGMSEYAATTACAIEFQQMAKRLSVPTMLLSQISNDGAKMGSEVVMSFKGSGAIAAAADLAIEITVGEDDVAEWKKKLQAGDPVHMKWNIRKNRHGVVGYVGMDFVGNTGIFTESVTIEDF